MLRSAPRCVRLVRPTLTVRTHVRPLYYARPSAISHLNTLLSRQAFHTRSILRERTAAPEPQRAQEDPAPVTPPPAQDAGAAAAEEPAAAEGEQAAETAEGAAGEGAATGEAAAGEAPTEEQRESYFKEHMEREEKQAWENIERFQKRVAAQHKLQQQILMKLIREVNELEETNKKEEEMLDQFTRDVTAEFKEAFRRLEERKQAQSSQAQTKEQ